MFHMLSCFDLGKETSINGFQASLTAFKHYMHEKDLFCTVGELGRRCSDTPMDTDAERDLEYYFIMTFHNRTQCDAAYDFIDNDSASHISHTDVISKVKNAVFICWEDIQERF